MSHNAGRIPSLDGLRGISIVLVLIGHLAGTRGFPVSAATGNRFAVAEVGVHVFFVISGFLITGLLLDELGREGRIRLGRFYFRRTLRIFPPYYAFIAVLLVAQALGWLALSPGDAAHALSYTSNYDASRSWWVGHTWSLSVEEQFYLLWPACLLLLGLRRGLAAAVLVVLLTPLIRLAELQWAPAYIDGIGHRFETVADAIAIGCVLACGRTWLHRNAIYMRFLESPAFLVVPVAIFAGSMLGDHPRAAYVVGLPVANVATALAVDWAVTYPSGRMGRVLNARALTFVGLISYSLYLWQQPFLNRAGDTPWTAFPLNAVLAITCALGSYYIVERPSLAVRKRIESRRTRVVPRPAIDVEPGVVTGASLTS
jgi:peptidoglycan/LPS O-acetylase OafA/YrhL